MHANDWEAWRAIEQLHAAGRVRKIGISNVTLEQLQTLLTKTRVTPSYVQNRCYATQAWGRDIRAFCRNHGMVYQAFSLLTANARILSHPTLVEIASRHHRNSSQIVLRFAIDAGMIPLTGTSQSEHMRMDLDVFNFSLNTEEVKMIERLAL